MCVITGKGPLKSYYANIIQAKQWQHVEICTPWLEPEDYPKLIGKTETAETFFMLILLGKEKNGSNFHIIWFQPALTLA